MTATAGKASTYQGNDKLLYGIILGVITFWLFAQTTLNIAPAMQKDLGLDASMMNIALAPTGSMATAFLLVGRALQGMSAACIMPASLALVKTYWDGPARQRAVSLWSIGSWGGSGVGLAF